MKILFSTDYPLKWAWGGYGIKIQNIILELRKLGVDIRWLNNDDSDVPDCDIIHYFGRPVSDFHLQLARSHGHKIVLTDMNPQFLRHKRSYSLFCRRLGKRVLPYVIGQGLYGRMSFGIYSSAAAVAVLNSAEGDYLMSVHGVDRSKCFIIPNGIDDVFLNKRPATAKSGRLLYLATIRDVKSQIEIADAAEIKGVPVDFIGDYLHGEEDYFDKFRKKLAGCKYSTWRGYIEDRNTIRDIIAGASGLFLASRYEAQGIVLLEALACGTPVMGPDLPTVRSYFGDSIQYCSPAQSSRFPDQLRAFYDSCLKGLKQSFPLQSWSDTAKAYYNVYKFVLENDRH